MEEKNQNFEIDMTEEYEANIIHGACPDIYNQVAYRLIREER